MKTYKNVYDICVSESNILVSIKSLKKSKRAARIIKERNMSDAELYDYALKCIYNYKTYKREPKQIYDGITRKVRKILVPTFEELIVQHCVVNALKPMFTKGMYEHSYASVPKRGPHLGKKIVEKWIRTDATNTKYVLKMDIYHFFDTIPIMLLKRKLKEHIKDEEMLKLLFDILDCYDNGLPLGFYTSQWLSNWYLQDFDHCVKERLKAIYYIRYMDDMVIFARSKRTLHKIRLMIRNYLWCNLGLRLKSNWQVYLFDQNGIRGRDVDFMGFRFFRNRTIMRKTLMIKCTRKARAIYKKLFPTLYDMRQMMAYFGWLIHTNTYHMYELFVKPYINFGYIKHRISEHDRKSDKYLYSKLTRLYKRKGVLI